MTKYVIEVPDEICLALEERASAAGSDVSQIIQTAVASFLRDSLPASRRGRVPDPPLEAIEISPPCDLPKTGPAADELGREDLFGRRPMPQRVRLVGRLAAVRANANAFDLVLDDRRQVAVQWSGGDMMVATGLMNERVLVLGTAIYDPAGNLLRIEADDVSHSDDASFFSIIPRAVSRSFDLDDILREQRQKPGLSAIIGQWPGDESDEEVAAALRELS